MEQQAIPPSSWEQDYYIDLEAHITPQEWASLVAMMAVVGNWDEQVINSIRQGHLPDHPLASLYGPNSSFREFEDFQEVK